MAAGPHPKAWTPLLLSRTSAQNMHANTLAVPAQAISKLVAQKAPGALFVVDGVCSAGGEELQVGVPVCTAVPGVSCRA